MNLLKFNKKPRPRLLDKRDAAATVRTKSAIEDAKVKRRSGLRCEVRVRGARCWRYANHIHHLIAGIGRRNRGSSILAEHKLHTCAECHRQITGHVLKPVNAIDREAAKSVRYERVA